MHSKYTLSNAFCYVLTYASSTKDVELHNNYYVYGCRITFICDAVIFVDAAAANAIFLVVASSRWNWVNKNVHTDILFLYGSAMSYYKQHKNNNSHRHHHRQRTILWIECTAHRHTLYYNAKECRVINNRVHLISIFHLLSPLNGTLCYRHNNKMKRKGGDFILSLTLRFL